MSNDTLKENVNKALLELIDTRDFNASSAYRMHNQKTKLKQRSWETTKRYKALDQALREAEAATPKNPARIQKIGDDIAQVKKDREVLRRDIAAYKKTLQSRASKEEIAEQKLLAAIHALRQAEGKEVHDFVPKKISTSDLERFVLRGKIIKTQIKDIDDRLLEVQGKLHALLQDSNITHRDIGKITYQTLQNELEQIEKGQKNSSLGSIEELKNLANDFNTLSLEAQKLDEKLERIEKSKKENGLYWFFFPIIKLFIGYAHALARQETVKEQQKEKQVFALFVEARDLTQDRMRKRDLEIEHQKDVQKAKKELEQKGDTLLELRRSFHAYCSDIDTLDPYEQPKSGSIAVDRAAAAASTFVTDTAEEVRKWGEQAATEVSKGIEELRENPQKTLQRVGDNIGDAITDVWNRWRYYQPTVQEDEEREAQKEPLLSGRESPAPSDIRSPTLMAEPTPKSVKQVAKSLRVFLGNPSYINLELLIHCMHENATYSVDAPEAFKKLLNQAIDFYPELGERIIALGEEASLTRKMNK